MTATHDIPGDAPQPLAMPCADEWLSWIDQRCSGQLDEARRLAGRLRAAPPSDPVEVLEAWNGISMALSNASGPASVISETHPEVSLRERGEAVLRLVDDLRTELSLDVELYAVLAGIDTADLDHESCRLLTLTLRDFTRSGVDRDDETRTRLRTLSEQETALGQEFARNIRQDVRAIMVGADELTGLPADYVAAHPADDDDLRTVTTDYPDVYPFLTYCRNAEARARLYVEFLSRGWPANDEVLRSLLTSRHEHATLLGFESWSDFDCRVKMIGTSRAVDNFIDAITLAADEPGRLDREVLLRRRRVDQPDATTITRPDVSYYAELIRKESFAVDAQLTRTYFDFAKVREGLLEVTGRLFGLRYQPVEEPLAWHREVAAYDVFLVDEPGADVEAERIGRIYLDLHPREGKFKHAAQFTWANGVAGRQLAEGVLVCNFPRGLMEHSDVITLFHEFGHLVHHVLAGRQRFVRFSGVATEWDFVEAPSQMLEEWAWNAEVLATFATDAAGEPIPADLVAQMRAAHDFGKGYLARTQMFYAALSHRLHLKPPDGDLTELVAEVQAAYDLFPFIEGTHFHTAFGHLESYSSAYYTYMWSLVIAKDLLSAFNPDDMFEQETATRYRDRVLVPGGSRDAADLVADFLGRPYDAAAFRAWLARPAHPGGQPAAT
ncbi:MAG: M3 family metallopeptidase [Nocardioidaceae bacterium]